MVSLGDAPRLIEMLCGLLNERFCGMLWRIGGASGAEAAAGHWVAASRIPSVAKWRSHVWYFKDSMRAAAVQETTDQILARLDAAGRSGAAVYAVADMLE